MSDVTSEPAQHIGDRTACLSALSRRIVDEVWQLPSITEVKDALECTVDNTYVTDHWCTRDKGMQSAEQFFEPPYGGLGTTYDVHPGLIGNRIVNFLSALIAMMVTSVRL